VSKSSHRAVPRSLRTAVAFAVVVAFIAPFAVMMPAWAAASGNLDQCTNGASGTTIHVEQCAGSSVAAVNGFKNWVNGNSNGSKSHWREGEFISYRTKISGIASGSHTLVLHYDTVHGGKHAIDYIGSFDATETTSGTPGPFHANNNNPCKDLVTAGQMQAAQCTPSAPISSTPVPAASLVNCNGSAGTFPVNGQIAGSFKMWGPSGSALNSAVYTVENVSSGSGQCSTTMRITFTSPAISTSQAIVIAWGGHIASQRDWGIGNSASAISGSPYHMALDLLDGASTGAQDRALSTSAIFFTPTISTRLLGRDGPWAIDAGGTAFDTATLSGASQDAGGTVTYTVYTDSACSLGARDGGTKTVTNGVVPNSNTLTFNTTGTFYWQASYSGDSTNQPAKSVCTSEILSVGQVRPTISTLLSTTSTSIGTPVHDSATLSGATSNAGGTVTYTVYTNSTCTLGARDAGTVNVTNGNVPDSTALSFNAAGDVYWQAVYSGDANNAGATSTCTEEHLVIGQNHPTISTLLSTTSTSIGTPVHDSATLSGATSNAGGTVTYTVYVDSSCTEQVAFAGVATVTNGVVGDSDPVSFDAAGDYYWQAVYGGDTNNASATSTCTEEHLVVIPNSPGGTTAQSLIPNDSGTITGATASAGGTFTFKLFSPSDATCSGTPALQQTVDVNGNGTYSTTNSTFVATSQGTWRWLVSYSGDSNNNGFTISCGAERFTIANS
jgi:hypothetical protein